jgi:hypothetical protein
MRAGNHPVLQFDPTGTEILAIATGSDACSEHECGSRTLMQALSKGTVIKEDLTRRIRKGEPVTMPALLDLKRAIPAPGLQFVDVAPLIPGGDAQALLGYSTRPLHDEKSELAFPKTYKGDGRDPDVAGAWCESGFALRVRGQRYVEALKRFYDAMLAGHVVFAGTFMPDAGGRIPARMMSGVVLAREDLFGPDIQQTIEKAQRRFESEIRLKALGAADQLMRGMNDALSAQRRRVHFGHVWPVWIDEAAGTVGYSINPSNGLHDSVKWGGRYTAAQLLCWAKAGCLGPIPAPATETASA